MIHLGHERLLDRAFELGEEVFVGVSSDELVPRLRKHHRVQPFALRRRMLRRFLKSKGWIRRAKIVKLDDPFGPASRRKDLEALVVSSDSRSNGLWLNSIRRARGLKPLRLYVVRLVRAEDGKAISSTRVRRREIDSMGRLVR